MPKLFDYGCLVLYCALIFWLSSQETLPTPHLFNYEDKLHHFLAYAVMAYLSWQSFRHFLSSAIILSLSVIVFSSLYGMSDEWHQSFVIGRDSSIGDWLADTLGAVLATAILYVRRAKVQPVTG